MIERKGKHSFVGYCCNCYGLVNKINIDSAFVLLWVYCERKGLNNHRDKCVIPNCTSIESVMPSSYLILCHPLLLLPPIPTSIRVFSNESTLCMRWPKYWIFSFSIISSKEIPGLISFRMDWLDLLAVQGTLKGLLQHHSSKASITRKSPRQQRRLSTASDK